MALQWSGDALVGSRTGAVPAGLAYLLLPVSFGSASLAKP